MAAALEVADPVREGAHRRVLALAALAAAAVLARGLGAPGDVAAATTYIVQLTTCGTSDCFVPRRKRVSSPATP